MKKLLSLAALLLLVVSVTAQTGIYIPSAKPIKNMKKAMENPDVFCVILYYAPGDSTYTIQDLDWLDSAYQVAFDRNNPKLYSMVIEGYGDADESLTRARVEGIYHYYANRCHAPFPIRYATNNVHCSCHGDTTEVLRYEVPADLRVYDCDSLPESRKMFNKTIALPGSVMITFRHDPDECIGMSRGCFLPGQDTTIRGYYTSLSMPKGAIYSVSNTKDSCPPSLDIRIEEHLNYREVLERFFLVPHRKHIIMNVGYIVIHSSYNRQYGECSLEQPDSIILKVPITQEQWDNKVRVFGKKYSEKGVEYKTLTTKKSKTKVNIALQTSLNVTQLDTLFLAKRIKPEELKDYFYEVKTDMEEGSFTYGHKHYKAYRLDKHGEMEIKKKMQILLRIVDDDEEEVEDNTDPVPDDELE